MTTLAYQDEFAGASAGNLVGHTSTSGNTYTQGGDGTHDNQPLVIDAVPSCTVTSSTTQAASAYPNWTPPSTTYGVGMLCELESTGVLQVGVGLRFPLIYLPTHYANYYYGCMDANSEGYYIYKVVNGSFTTLAHVAHTFTAGESHYLYFLSKNSGSNVVLTLYIDGTQVAQGTDVGPGSPWTLAGALLPRLYGPSSTTTTGPHVLQMQTDAQVGTLSVPSLTEGVQSGNFTATLEVPATLGTTATLSDGGAGGTFSPTSLMWIGGTSSGIGSQTATFTYTPAITGTINFTVAVTTPATTFNIIGSGSASAASNSFIISELAVPSHHAGGSLNVHAVGTGTTWTTGTTFSVSGVSGWSIVSVTIADATHATLTLACPVTGGSTGTLAIYDGLNDADLSVGAPALSVSQSSISGWDSVPITLTGTNTIWSDDSPVFLVSGGTGATLSSISFISNTSATAILYAGSQLGATLTITDPSTGATTTVSVSNTVNTTAYVTKSGSLVVFGFANSSNQPATVTAVNANPTISVNGSPVTCLGPFWHMINQNTPLVVYQLPSAVSPSATLSFSAAAGWATTNYGSATVYYDGPVSNFTGGFEAPLYGYTAFDYLPPSGTGMQAGINVTGNATNVPVVIHANWLKRIGFPGNWSGILTADATGSVTGSAGRPLTISGTIAATIADNNNINFVDTTDYPDLAGAYTLVIDDWSGTSQSGAMKAYMTCTSGAATITSGPTTAAEATTAGTPGTVQSPSGPVTGLVGQTWTWTVTRSGSPTRHDLGLVIQICTPNSTAGNYTATNEWLFAPTSDNGPAPTSLSRADPVALDPSFMKWVNLGTKGPAALRYVAASGGWGSNQVDASDVRSLTDFVWSGLGNITATATITEIRPYSLSTSPYVYTSNSYPGTTANVTPPNNLAYYWSPESIAWPICSGPSTAYEYVPLEFVCSEPHGFKTGQTLIFSGSDQTFNITNGSSGTVSYTLEPSVYGNWYWPIFVTGATTFVSNAYGIVNATTLSGLVANTAAETYSISGSLTATVTTPYGPSLPWEVMANSAAKQPGCALYCNISGFLTDAAVTTIAQRILAYLPAGHKVYVEFQNEAWNSGTTHANVTSNKQVGNLIGLGSWSGQVGTDWYILRASQLHALFASVFGTAGRSGDIIYLYCSLAEDIGVTTPIVSGINAYNAANPSTPIRMDCLGIAPYLDLSGGSYPDMWPNPASQATVSVGSGSSSLAAGTYYVAQTYIDSLSGLESAIGSSTSASFTTTSGSPLATVVWNDSVPAHVGSRNVYVGTSAGALYQYATGVPKSAGTYTLTLATSTTTAPPTNNLMPAFRWGAASLASTAATSLANTSVTPGNPYASNPWTYAMWLDWARHFVKYQTFYGGPPGLTTGAIGIIASQAAALAGYNRIAGQATAPYLITYEAQVETLVDDAIETVGPYAPNLMGQLTHDIFYSPDFYYVMLAYYQFLQQVGFQVMVAIDLAADPNYNGGNIEQYASAVWAGQQAGHGDGRGGGVTNQFWANTGKAEDLVNVSPRLQAWQDWASAGNPLPQVQIASFRGSTMIRSRSTPGQRGRVVLPSKTPTPEIDLMARPMMVRAATRLFHSGRSAVMKRVNLLPVPIPVPVRPARKLWFPGLRRLPRLTS